MHDDIKRGLEKAARIICAEIEHGSCVTDQEIKQGTHVPCDQKNCNPYALTRAAIIAFLREVPDYDLEDGERCPSVLLRALEKGGE